MCDREFEMVLQPLEHVHDAPPVAEDSAIGGAIGGMTLEVWDHEVVHYDTFTTFLEPPFDRRSPRASSTPEDVPAQPGVVSPAGGEHLESQRPRDHRSASGRDPRLRKDKTMTVTRCRVRHHIETHGSAAVEPSRPAVEVGECPVGDADRSADEDGVGHVPDASATNATMRSSSGSAS